MTEYSKEVREEAARRANEGTGPLDAKWSADTIADCHQLGRALCQAVQDGALHLDPVALHAARWKEAQKTDYPTWEYCRLVREGWTPPEPVDPVAALGLELEWWRPEDVPEFQAALAKLGLKIVPEDGK